MEPARVNAERLHERALSDSFWLTALSHTYEQLYMANWDLGDVDAALKAASKCLEFTKLWSDADSGNHEALQRLAVALTIFGNASRRLNKLGDVHKAHSSALEIRKGPANADPKNTTVEDDLGISWSRRVDVYWDEADYSHALDAWQQDLTIMKKLVETAPTNASWQENLAESYSGIGSALGRLGRTGEARQAYQSALLIRQALAKTRPLNVQLAGDIAWTLERISNLGEGEAEPAGPLPIPLAGTADGP